MKASHLLEQGDIVRVNFNPSMGHEPARERPALVVSGFGFNSRSSLVCVAPITSQNNGYPLHIPIQGDDTHGFACIEQVRTLDLNHRGFCYVGVADDDSMRNVMGALRGMLELR